MPVGPSPEMEASAFRPAEGWGAPETSGASYLESLGAVVFSKAPGEPLPTYLSALSGAVPLTLDVPAWEGETSVGASPEIGAPAPYPAEAEDAVETSGAPYLESLGATASWAAPGEPLTSYLGSLLGASPLSFDVLTSAGETSISKPRRGLGVLPRGI